MRINWVVMKKENNNNNNNKKTDKKDVIPFSIQSQTKPSNARTHARPTDTRPHVKTSKQIHKLALVLFPLNSVESLNCPVSFRVMTLGIRVMM